MIRKYLAVVLVWCCVASAASAQDGHIQTQERNPVLPVETLAIDTAKGNFEFTVEMAMTPEQQRLGLMNRSSLAANSGMLFVFPEPQPVAFWMKNTLIFLDMVFINAQGKVTNIVKEAKPLTEEPRPSDGDVRAVLEIAGGMSDKIGLRAGDQVIHTVFGNGR